MTSELHFLVKIFGFNTMYYATLTKLGPQTKKSSKFWYLE